MHARRRTAVAAALLLVSVGALSACSEFSQDTQEPQASASVEPVGVVEGDVVGEDGLTLEVDGVTVEFPAGSATGAVVESGAVSAEAAPDQLNAADDSADTPEDLTEASSEETSAEGLAGAPLVPLAGGVSLSLDDGLTQPSLPVTVMFPLPAGSLPDPASTEGAFDAPSENPTDVPTEAVPVGESVAAGNLAFVVQSDDGTVDLVPATYDETTGTVSGEVSHFSSIWPVSIDIGAMVETVLQTVGATSPKPGCEGQKASVEGEVYSVVSNPLMWLCVRGERSGLVVEATANAAFPFFAEPSVAPDPDVSLPAATGAAFAATLVSEKLGMVPEGKAAVFPGGAARMVYSEAPGTMDIDFGPAPDLLVISILSELGFVLLSMTPAEFADTVGGLECMGGVGELFEVATGGALTPAVAAQVSSAFFSCVGTVAELSPVEEVVVALFATAPQLVIGTLWGAVTTAAGASTFAATVQMSGGGDLLTAGNVEPFVGTWSGPVKQDGSQAYRVEVTISVGADGKPTAQVRYPELGNCAGTWDSQSLTGRTLDMVEHIEPGNHTCVSSVDIEVRRVGETLKYVADSSGILATATLKRGALKTPPTGAGPSWPTGKNEGPPALMVWLGANMYDFPNWVACDDADDWCLVGGSGQHMLVEMDGLIDHGTVANDIADAVAGLVELGAPQVAATQLMS